MMNKKIVPNSLPLPPGEGNRDESWKNGGL
jgi:hypothetical protein